MNKYRFAEIRAYLGKTQKQMAQLMGTSAKAIESFEQGWRNITPHIERQVYFLLSQKMNMEGERSLDPVARPLLFYKRRALAACSPALLPSSDGAL